MKHLHKCGKYLIRLDNIHSISDVHRGFCPQFSDYPIIPIHFVVTIGNEFGVGKLEIDDYPKEKVEELRDDLVKAWEEYLIEKDGQ